MFTKLKALWNKAIAYVKAHADHFMISIGCSVVVTIITNVIIHYMADIMLALHWSRHLVHMLTTS